MVEDPAVERPSYNSCDAALEPRGEWVEKTDGKLMRKDIEKEVAEWEAVELGPSVRSKQTRRTGLWGRCDCESKEAARS